MPFNSNEICECGKCHKTAVSNVEIKRGAINAVPEYAKKYNAKKAFIVADVNTYPIAGEKIKNLLEAEGITCTEYVFTERKVDPNENSVGGIILKYDMQSDVIIAVGSGAINDICKVLAHRTGTPYIIVASAAYMDGYASGNSSMAYNGIKITVPTKSPDVIIGDIDILSSAPLHMAKSGLGDMLAKYTAICEWRLSNLINGEYYCEKVAQFTRDSLKKCVDGAAGLLTRDAKSMEMLFEGLINCGRAMDYSGVSRPGGGVEHYVSFILDMRGLAFGTPVAPHGTQCAIGTLYAIKCYEELRKIVPDRQKALEYVKRFDFDKWSQQLYDFIGKGAEPMIKLEAKEQKYNLEKHKKRLEVILDNWEEIIKILDEELPTSKEFEKILDTIEAPKSAEDIGITKDVMSMTLKCTKDIRDKYVLPRLLWDLGVLDEVCNKVFGK